MWTFGARLQRLVGPRGRKVVIGMARQMNQGGAEQRARFGPIELLYRGVAGFAARARIQRAALALERRSFENGSIAGNSNIPKRRLPPPGGPGTSAASAEPIPRPPHFPHRPAFPTLNPFRRRGARATLPCPARNGKLPGSRPATRSILHRGLERNQAHLDALPNALPAPARADLAKVVGSRIHSPIAFRTLVMQFHSQVGQDQFLFERFFLGKRNGTFVDIGAYDGQTFSNSLFFEQNLGWTGLCVEPLPTEFEKLKARRTATCVNCGVSDYDGFGDMLDVDVRVDAKMLSGLIENYDQRHVERIDRIALQKNVIRVPVTTFSNLLLNHNLTKIDYCSIDTEGSELKILQGLDFDRFDISLFTIENNYNDTRIETFMAEKGYELVVAFGGYDQLYKKKHVQMLPRTTVFCAVWHGDPRRFELLEGHSANLDQQTRPIERVYVFDGGDVPPAELRGSALTCRDKLSIYQAWNLALAAVGTPYVMNLNLDDRLAPDAVAILENVLDQGNDLVGGDWKICYTQKETDAVVPAFPATDLPYVPNWPPSPGVLTRLGSGTGSRHTLGPACMWRTLLHQSLGRYPHQFGDGTLIRVIGDGAWWQLLLKNQRKLRSVPSVIGNYFSHPQDQAEFRNRDISEKQRLNDVGVRLV